MQRSHRSTPIVLCLLLIGLSFASAAVHHSRLKYPDPSNALVKQPTRGGSGLWKLDAGLLDLYYQYDSPARQRRKTYSSTQLASRFGITSPSADPVIGVAMEVVPGTSAQTIHGAIGMPILSAKNQVYASIHTSALSSLAGQDWVQSIGPLKPAARPHVPALRARTRRPLLTRGGVENPADFDHKGLTGKGVIVGIIDSGLDFRHKDFLNRDGTTRVLAIWDTTDNSFAKSKGKIGSAPPYAVDGKPLGTVYTRDQLNAALKGAGKVNTKDSDGHGTACAGVAAGSSSAFPGVAPDADIVIVKCGNEGVNQYYVAGAQWIIDQAKAAKEPCVISMSFGSMDTGHDGYDESETALDNLAGPSTPGVALCAAAGNDGLEPAHAAGRFGPRKKGQEDISSEPAELFVLNATPLEAFLSASDEWGVAIVGSGKFLADAKGRPNTLYIEKVHGKLRAATDQPPASLAALKKLFDSVVFAQAPNKAEDELVIPLQPGNYAVYAYGATASVSKGSYDFYLPFPEDASFGAGSDSKCLVSSPGNASEVIAVGAYNFRRSWANSVGSQTNYNLSLGDIASYSSPGFRRDGVVKPDLVAPASFSISPLAKGSAMGKTPDNKVDSLDITKDGRHIAWAGTSAACPYVAGVVALMLQKNPTLTQRDIQHILDSTAASDQFTGAVPNPNWGYGKIDPAAALAHTPDSSNASQ
jgi:subtilisin family serine protease